MAGFARVGIRLEGVPVKWRGGRKGAKVVDRPAGVDRRGRQHQLVAHGMRRA